MKGIIKYILKKETGGSLKTATLQSGNFNGITFATNLKNSLNSVGSTIFDVVYSTTANKIVINNGTGGVFSFTQGSNSGLYEAGLENQYGSFATSFTSANLDLSGLKIINIASNFGGLTINSRSNSRLLASIITEEASLAVSSHIDESNDYISSNVNQLSSINLSFQDDQFRSLTLDKDYQLELLLKRKQDE